MAYDDVITRNDEDELALRVASVREGSGTVSYDDVYTRDERGRLAVRVVGGAGGADPHSMGYYATPEALSEAHPTAEAGDYAIVGSTDTVWVWDTDTSAWVNSAVSGSVISVNNQTGVVTLTATDVGAQPTLVSGTNIKTIDGNSVLGSGNLELSTYLTYPAGWPTNGTTAAFCDAIAADTSATVGKAYLGEVTLNDMPSGISNAEIKVEIMDGTTAATKVIVLTMSSGNVSPYMWQYVYWDEGVNVSGWKGFQEQLVSGTNIKTINNTSILGSGDITVDSLPAQSGQNGRYLTTDGSAASWGAISFPVTSVNTKTGAVTLTASDVGALPDNTHIPADPVQADWDETNSSALDYIKNKPTIPAAQVNSDWNASSGVAQILNKPTLAAVATSGAYADLSGTPSIPTKASDVNAVPQLSTLPTAGVDYLGQVVQFVGTTGTYTNGYFYECVSDGQATPTYSWTQKAVQPSSGGLPSQSGNAGKFLTTDGTDPSWATISALQNTATGTDSLTILGTSNNQASSINIGTSSSAQSQGVAIGYNAQDYSRGIVIGYNAQSKGSDEIVIGQGATGPTVNGENSITLGYNAKTSFHGAMAIGGESSAGGQCSIAIGSGYRGGNKGAIANANFAIQLGTTGVANGAKNTDANTFKVANSNGNYEMMSADGTIPTDRFTTTPVADGTYVPTLTISSGVASRSWTAPGGGGSVPTLTWYTVSTAGNTLTIADTSSAQLVKIYKNGLLLQPTEDYTISGTTLTTVGALVVGDKITTELF